MKDDEQSITVTLNREQAMVLTGAARYMAKKRRKDAKKKPFVPLPGHYNLNERKAELLTDAVRKIQKEIDESR